MSPVSWDHFFLSLNHYYMSLRQEVPTATDMAHLYRHYTKGITPQEVDGLTAVLQLIRTIAEQVRLCLVYATCLSLDHLVLVYFFVPRIKTNIGTRIILIAAPTLWNSLPVGVRSAGNKIQFCHYLKTGCLLSLPPKCIHPSVDNFNLAYYPYLPSVSIHL